jgi:hypothetical protein
MPDFSQLDDRQLRLRIARVRRRMDGNLHAIGREGRRMVSWRELVRRHPGYAALAAAGSGLVFSTVLRRGRLARWLGVRLVREAAGGLAGQLGRELRQILAGK